jgi:hypothetical protein
MRQFILVAGVDYEFHGVDFRLFCDNRRKRLVARSKKTEDLTFRILDIRKGEVITHELTFPKGKQVEKVTKLTPSPFKSIGKANYDSTVVAGETHYRFKEGQRDKMSILDVYRTVQQVGVDAPGTLAELSIFSHAFMGGPILVNSFDDGIVNLTLSFLGGTFPFSLPSGARDPDDMDPRAAKDFVAPTMTAAALANLQAAFSPDGFIWIWGCAFPRLVHEMLHKIERHPSYRDRGVADDEVFKITNFDSAHADTLEAWLLPERGPIPDKKKIEIEFKFLKHFFCKITEASYTHALARNAQVKVFGGLMGTYSDYDQGSLPLMSVHKGFARHFAFYQNYLGFGFDPEGRKYGEYKPAFVCTPPSP